MYVFFCVWFQRRKATIKQKELVHSPSSKKSASSKQVSISFSRSDDSQDEQDNQVIAQGSLHVQIRVLVQELAEMYLRLQVHNVNVTEASGTSQPALVREPWLFQYHLKNLMRLQILWYKGNDAGKFALTSLQIELTQLHWYMLWNCSCLCI